MRSTIYNMLIGVVILITPINSLAQNETQIFIESAIALIDNNIVSNHSKNICLKLSNNEKIREFHKDFIIQNKSTSDCKCGTYIEFLNFDSEYRNDLLIVYTRVSYNNTSTLVWSDITFFKTEEGLKLFNVESSTENN